MRARFINIKEEERGRQEELIKLVDVEEFRRKEGVQRKLLHPASLTLHSALSQRGKSPSTPPPLLSQPSHSCITVCVCVSPLFPLTFICKDETFGCRGTIHWGRKKQLLFLQFLLYLSQSSLQVCAFRLRETLQNSLEDFYIFAGFYLEKHPLVSSSNSFPLIFLPGG